MTAFRAAVTGLGLVTPAGLGVGQNWARVLSGEPTARSDPDLAGLPVDFACRVRDFDPVARLGESKAWRLDRHQQFALVAAWEAVSDAALTPGEWDGGRVGIVIGTGAGGTATMEAQQSVLTDRGAGKVSARTLPMGLPNMASGLLAMDLGAYGPNLSVSTACASGATAIGVAREMLRSGTADIVLAGGAEAAVTPLFVSTFARARALSLRRTEPERASRPFDAARDGFVIGEGAGVLVLETEEHARARGAPVRAFVTGYGASSDGYHVTAPDPDGAGVRRAISAALSDAEIMADEVQYINAHGTSTPLNDVIEARTIRKVFGGGVAVSSTKGVTGHTLGAAGAIEAVYTVLALHNGCIPPTANLDEPDADIDVDLVRGVARRARLDVVATNSFGFGGQNAVLLMTK